MQTKFKIEDNIHPYQERMMMSFFVVAECKGLDRFDWTIC